MYLKETSKTQAPAFPPGVTNANWFGFYNTISFQIYLGAPLILYVKQLGASATFIGLVASLTPLLSVLQVPAARHLSRFGYKRFTLIGWGVRSISILGMVAIPWLPMEPHPKLSLLFWLLVVGNVARGFVSGAWMPWITQIVPEDVRPRFLARDGRFGQAGALLAMLFCGLVLSKDSAPWEFSSVFLFSAVCGILSLMYLWRMPDSPHEEVRRSSTPVPWMAILRYPPFFRLLIYSLFMILTYGGFSVFNITFMKTRCGLGDNEILLLFTTPFLASIFCLGLLRRLLERYGSKPMLCTSLALHACVMAGWVLMAVKIMPSTLLMVIVLTVMGGTISTGMALASTRILMGVMPEMGRAHFFALHSVITCLFSALSPIFWGMFLDVIKGVQMDFHGLEVNRYSVYFSIVVVLGFACVWPAWKVLEKPVKPERTD